MRLDIQGLRMVAVVLVLLAHIFGWPRGGFIGVDVFFVISGFLITGILLRDVEKFGHVSFTEFYRRRIRRIVPAATLTLAAIVVTAGALFGHSRAVQVWWDSLSAFLFVSNWRFAVTGIDYFTAGGAVSPVRHFWSLSVEEQFYFVWPAVMAVIVTIAARRAMSANARHRIAGAIMAVLVAASFTWAVADTAANPTWSYFSSLTRVWELGFGALLAIFASSMCAIPDRLRPVIAWAGLGLIGFGAFWITEDIGFPGPWAAVPVLGSGLVLVAGTRAADGAASGEALRWLWPLTNKVSVKIGDLSYSLYLWHWPVLIFLGTYFDLTWRYYLAATAITVALSTLTYYYVEQPILASSWLKPREQQEWRQSRSRNRRAGRRPGLRHRLTFEMTSVRQAAGLAGLALLAGGLLPLATAPRDAPAYISAAEVADTQSDAVDRQQPPALAALQQQIKEAATAERWPALNPSMEDVIAGPKEPPEAAACRSFNANCWFGADTAPHTVVLAGDSIAMSYLAPMITFVESSGGQWKLLSQASTGCPLINVQVRLAEDWTAQMCPGRRQEVVDKINRIRPDVVVISNTYGQPLNAETGQPITTQEWQKASGEMVSQFSAAVGRIAFLTAPPPDKSPAECYRPGSSPAECVGRVRPQFTMRLESDTAVAQAVRGEVLDTRPLFCTSSSYYCPMFVGTTPMRVDAGHISPGYQELIKPAFAEMLSSSATFTVG